MNTDIYTIFSNLFTKHSIEHVTNKYFRWYCELIYNAKSRSIPEGYTEKHHFIPRSIGDLDDTVHLTAKEHLVSHHLLPKFLTGEEKMKMSFAFHRMVTSWAHGGSITARQYETAMILNSQALKAARMDSTIYHFIHKDGTEEHCTRMSLEEKYSLPYLGKLFSKNPRGSQYGWRLAEKGDYLYGSGKGKNNGRYDHTQYHFIHLDGTREHCTRGELQDKYGLKSIEALFRMRNRYKTRLGWSLDNAFQGPPRP